MSTDTHPLHCHWQFWYHKRVNKADPKEPEERKDVPYRDQLIPLGKIATLEEFFGYYSRMHLVAEMPREVDLFLFRDGEVPMWEESPKGGIWISKCRKEDNVDAMWEALTFAMIGEQFADSNVIGVNLSLRGKERLIQIWLKDASDLK